MFCARCIVLLIGILLTGSIRAQGVPVAMLTLPQGEIVRLQGGQREALGPFSTLAAGDVLQLNGGRVSVLYPQSGRVEVWQGNGRLRVGVQHGEAEGLAPPLVGRMPGEVAQQIARSPAGGTSGAQRTRSLVMSEPASIDDTYRRLRQAAPADDLNPEMYLLSALFERRDYARIEQVLAELKSRQPGNPEVGMLAALYGKALRNVRRQ